jgi:Phospholipase B
MKISKRKLKLLINNNFYYFLRVEFDETYAFCATVYYSEKVGYRIKYHGQRNDFDNISDGCARACYKDRRATTGLSFLEIETQTGYNDKVQAFGAGMIEGSLTWMNIYAQWRNTIESYCGRSRENELFCKWLRDVVAINFENVQKLAEDQRKTDAYHHQVFLFYHQLQGIEAGFNRGTKRKLNFFKTRTYCFC